MMDDTSPSASLFRRLSLKNMFCGKRDGEEASSRGFFFGPSRLASVVREARSGDVCQRSGAVVTPEPTAWLAKMQELLTAGKDDVFIVLEFDRVITKRFLETGGRVADSYDVLASVPKVTPGCKRMMEVLMDKYYPVEMDPKIPIEEKCVQMQEWYSLLNELIGQQRLTQNDVAKAVEGCKDIRLRDGVEELFQLANCAGIPVVIISAGVTNIIEDVIARHIRGPSGATGEAWSNVKVFGNTLLWDSEGNFDRFSEPVMHPFSKSFKNAPQDLLDVIQGRGTGILIGEGLGDLSLADGYDASRLLKFGFLNERVDERLARYTTKGAYDRVILNDWSFEPLLEVMRPLCTVNCGPASVEVSLSAIITPSTDAWESKVSKILAGGVDRLFFVVDFDRTITKCFLETGERSADCHEILYTNQKVTWQCKRTLEVLLERWYPIETDPDLSNERKSAEMVEWYSLVNALLGSQGLTPEDVELAVKQCTGFRLRAGVEEVFQFAYRHDIPMVVLSAGLGNIIEEVIRQRIRKPNGETGKPWKNVRVLSNTLLWGKDGGISFSEPILHPFNKSLTDAPPELHDFIRGRDNAILAGDGMGDLTMDIGTNASNVLKLGFLNERIDERVAKYTSEGAYDRVVLSDGSFETLLEVLKELK